MIMDASPLQLTVGVFGLALFALVWIYLACRLGAHGVIRSWFEFINNRDKEGKNDQQGKN
jgi:hypothetical protein